MKWLTLALGLVVFSAHASEPLMMKVMTLNVAHARAEGPSQLLQSVEDAKQNLYRIADVMRREQPDIAAFQEIDRDSFWNGGFDHTAYLASNAEYPHFFSGAHIDGQRLEYGTALVAKQMLSGSSSVKFSQPFARPRKGFVVSTIHWPGTTDIEVDVVSVHLDFLTRGQRMKEIHRLIEVLSARKDRPVIIMGDLNAEYEPDKGVLPVLKKALALNTWLPSEALITFPKFNKRIDWVLVSDDIEIVSHEVLPEALSDHRAIVAELRLIPS